MLGCVVDERVQEDDGLHDGGDDDEHNDGSQCSLGRLEMIHLFRAPRWSKRLCRISRQRLDRGAICQRGGALQFRDHLMREVAEQ